MWIGRTIIKLYSVVISLIVQEDNIDWAGDIKAQGRVMGEAHAIRGILLL